jgi:hypothetical protein
MRELFSRSEEIRQGRGTLTACSASFVSFSATPSSGSGMPASTRSMMIDCRQLLAHALSPSRNRSFGRGHLASAARTLTFNSSSDLAPGTPWLMYKSCHNSRMRLWSTEVNCDSTHPSQPSNKPFK